MHIKSLLAPHFKSTPSIKTSSQAERLIQLKHTLLLFTCPICHLHLSKMLLNALVIAFAVSAIALDSSVQRRSRISSPHLDGRQNIPGNNVATFNDYRMQQAKSGTVCFPDEATDLFRRREPPHETSASRSLHKADLMSNSACKCFPRRDWRYLKRLRPDGSIQRMCTASPNTQRPANYPRRRR